MVLDGEQDEASRVLLEEGLLSLLFLDRGRDSRLNLLEVILEVIWNADDGLESVLLLRRREVKLLCGRVGHLECVNGRRNLLTR
jgi:hypothetical protein